MPDLFTVYRKYPSTDHAQILLDILDVYQIEHMVERTAPLFDATFAQNHLNEEIVIKIRTSDFERVNQLLEKSASETYETIERDYYLFDYSNEELIDIVIKPDEWNSFDYQLAQQILKERGTEVPVEIAKALKKERIESTSRKEVSPTTWIWAGYILSGIGGLLGFFIGWHLVSHSKVLSDGQTVKVYDHTTQTHGKRIMIIGGIGTILWTILRLTILSNS